MSKVTIVLEDTTPGMVSVTSELVGNDSPAFDLAARMIMLVDQVASKVAGQEIAVPHNRIAVVRH